MMCDDFFTSLLKFWLYVDKRFSVLWRIKKEFNVIDLWSSFNLYNYDIIYETVSAYVITKKLFIICN